MSRRRYDLTLFGAILFILWVAFAVAYYFVMHKPWWDHISVAPFAALLDILLAIVLVSLAGGMGRQILPAMEGANALERVALETALGLGTLSLVVLMVGLLGWFSRWVAWIGLVGGLVGFRKGVMAWYGTWRQISRESRRVNRLGKFAFGFIVLLWSFNLLWALAPPLKWDSLVYHLQIPAKYVAAGRIFYYPENLYAGFPQLAGMLYTWAIALGSVTTATTLCWAVSVVMFVGVEGFSRRILGKGVAWMAPAILLSGFSISGAMHWGYVDLWIMFFGMLTLLCLDIYLSSRKRLWLILAAAMVGFAIGTKYTAGASLIIAVFLLFWGWMTNWRRGNDRNGTVDRQPDPFLQLFMDWAILAGIALIIASPWLLKNWMETGNPFHPAPYFTDGLDPWSQTFFGDQNPNRELLNDVFLPFEVTFYGIEGAIVEGKIEYGANVGPLIVALIPGLLLGWQRFSNRQQSSLTLLLVAALVTWVIWSISAYIAVELVWPRHYYAVFPAAAILATAGFEAASTVKLDQIRMRRVLGALVILTFALAAYAELSFIVKGNPFLVILGRQTKMEYLFRNLGRYAEAMQAITDLPPESYIYFLWEPRTLYCQDRNCFPDGITHNWSFLRNVYGDSEEIQAALCKRGITHVLINDLGLSVFQRMEPDFQPQDRTELDEFRRGALVNSTRFGDEYSLYELACANESQ